MGSWKNKVKPAIKWIFFCVLFLFVNALAPISILNPKLIRTSKQKLKQIIGKYVPFIKTSLNPKLLRHVPNTNDTGVIVDTFLLKINDASNPYNPSVLVKDGGFEIFYREDVKKNHFGPGKLAHAVLIKKAAFSDRFEQKGDSLSVDLGTHSAEDPRVIAHKESEFIVFNDFYKRPSPSNHRSMFLADLRSNSFSARRLDFGLQKIEKNWTPFIYNDSLHFVYKIDPFKVLHLQEGALSNVEFLDSNLETADLSHWKWGELRGGTQAIHIGTEYLSFFHSFFIDDGNYFYVAGAYTFSDKPPFRLKKISRTPLKFPEMYSAPLCPTAESNKRVLYPSSLVLDKNPHFAYLFCGENDSAIRVIKLNLQTLLSSMVDLDEETEKKLKLKTSLTLK